MKEFSFLNTILLINGKEMTGYDDSDDSIDVERLGDSADHIMGNDGEMTLNLSADRSGIFRFKLMMTSDANRFMSGLINGQENGAFVPIFAQFKDTITGDMASGTQGYIPRPSGMKRGGKAGSQLWSVVVERLDLLHRLA